MEGENANLTNKKTGINKLFRQIALAQTPSFRRSIWVMIPNTQKVYTVYLGALQKKCCRFYSSYLVPLTFIFIIVLV